MLLLMLLMMSMLDDAFTPLLVLMLSLTPLFCSLLSQMLRRLTGFPVGGVQTASHFKQIETTQL